MTPNAEPISDDTNGEESPARRRSRAAQYVWPTTIATTASLVASGTLGGYQMGARDVALKQDILNQVRLEYVTKDTSENRGAILSSDVQEIRRTVAEIKETIKGIPRLEAQIEVLQERVK